MSSSQDSTKDMDSQDSHDGLPIGLRNKKMKPTECLLFAATLLSQEDDLQPGRSDDAARPPNHDTLPLDDRGDVSVPRRAPSMRIPPMIPSHTAVPSSQPTTDPREVDVLCGRGGLINKHPGNVVYRKVVDYNKPFYQSVHKKHRILVSQSIVQSILKFGGRFLTHGAKGKDWYEIGYKRAVQKTSQALRERIQSTEEGDEDDEEDD